MKTNLLLSNNNLFAFALCFAAFTAQADDLIDETDATENVIDVSKTLPIIVKNIDGYEVEVDAIVITLDEAKKILTAEQAEEFVAMFHEVNNKENIAIDGVSFTINDTTYFVKSSEFADEKDELTKVNVDAAGSNDVATSVSVNVNETDDEESIIVDKAIEEDISQE